MKELYYRENCSDGTSCIKAFPSRHKARPLCLPFSAILQECGRPLAGRGPWDQRAPPATPVPAGAGTEENRGSRPPPRHCGVVLGWGHGAPHPGHRTWRGAGSQAGPPRRQHPLGRWHRRARTHTDTESGARGGARGGAGGGRVTCSASPGGGWCIC